MYKSVNEKFKGLINNISDNKLKNADLNQIDTMEILRFRIYLKSTQKINNVQYSILGDLKSQIEEYQKYKYEPALKRIDEIIDSYDNHSVISSNSGTNLFLKTIQSLSIISKESIVNADKFNDFSKYIHVKRGIEDQLLEECKKLQKQDSGLILLVGSVGDGKSHLLAYLKNEYPDLFKDVLIHNDATESNNPTQTATQTLESILTSFYKENRKMVIAINIGMLHNFHSYLQKNNILPTFQKFINDSMIFDSKKESISSFSSDMVNNHSIISFLSEQKISINDGQVNNNFYSELIKRIFSPNEDNPIYSAFIADEGYKRREPIYKNYRLLLNSNIQNTILYMLNLIQIQDKRILTARSVLNFLYDIIVPTEDNKDEHTSLLVSLLFENKEKSKILESISHHDPSQYLIQELESLNIRVYNTDNLATVCKELFNEDFDSIEDTILYLSNLDNKRHFKKYSTIIRFYFLFNHEKFISNNYKRFLNLLEDKDKNTRKTFLKNLEYVIYNWNGTPSPGYIYKKPWNSKDNVRIGIEFKCKFEKINVHRNSIFITIYDENDTSSPVNYYTLEIDYPLYLLIQKVSTGYMLKSSDRSDAINFNEFVEDVIENTVSMKSTIIKSNSSNRLFKVSSGILSPEIEEL